MRTDKYVLDGKTPKPDPDLISWARWFETADRHVAVSEIGDVKVSTVFLGLDHNFIGDGPPVLFETMTFGPAEEICERCSTWEEAEAQHARVCEIVESRGSD